MCSIIGDMKDASLTPDQDVLEGCSHALRVTTPNQDILEGWVDLDIQGGHLMQRKGW